MSKSLLITRPRYDLITSYFYVWSESIINFAKNKMIPVYDLRETKATKNNFESYISARKPSLIFVNAHGNPQEILGQDGEVIIDKKSSKIDSIIYARSCDAAQILGSILIQNGIKTFIGYTRKFILGYKPNCISAPLTDNLAKLFLEPSNSIATILLKGHSAQVAHNRSRAQMYKYFRKMISSTATYEERYAARWLWSNFKSQVLIGSNEQKI